MCGIAGIFNFDASEHVDGAVIERMNSVQFYRGPDEGGMHLDGSVGLGNRRLAIVDRAHGHQPMSNLERTHWITYNGEIYNHKALRVDLEARGYTFRTASDTEVVLRCYEAFGTACVERFQGQFAFAIWDGPSRKLFLARDHLGIAPLHYTRTKDSFVFASEAKALMVHPQVAADIDPEAVAEILLCSTLFAGRTMFRDIHQLPPGHRLVVTQESIREETYWDIPLTPNAEESNFTEDDYAERLLPMLEDALRSRLADEVPWGLMLSGGTDSSTLLAIAGQFGPDPVTTFTIDYPNRWKGANMDAHFAAMMAERAGSRHFSYMIEPEDYFESLRQVTWHAERPFNKGALTMYMLYQRIQEQATVCITGEGADELFAGYVGSRGLGLDDALLGGEMEQIPWAAYWKDTCRLFSDDFVDSVQPEALFRQRFRDALAPITNRKDSLNAALYLYTKYFLLELLELHDRTSLAFGVEARLPFIDHRYVELLSPMPSKFKYRDGSTKHIFKRVLRDIIPDEILDRPKTPMPIPRDPATVDRQLRLARELLSAEGAMSAAYLDPKRVELFLDRRDMFASTDTLTLWKVSMYLITLEILCREFHDRTISTPAA
jgi:asparagine synthase (glutamine-hydrolysing)